MTIEQLFFELIRVSIGVSGCLSKTPTKEEWKALYDMAKKQSLVGVCFAGVQRLQQQRQEPPEMLYLTWMGMAAKIQQRNEVVSRQCVELQKLLSDNGFKSCILKGQGVALTYPEHLKGLRQSGDIDVWMWCEGDLKERRAKIIEYARKREPDAKAFIHHVDCRVFDDTETEFHYLPSWFNSPISHHRFVKWCEGLMEEQMNHKVGDITTPTVYFNSIYMLAHIYQHLFQEGIGLRQLMDYYFVLRQFQKVSKFQEVSEINAVLKEFGLTRLAGAVMWVLKEIFALPEEQMVCKPDEEEGRFLLNEIMQAGNFGKYDKRIERNGAKGLNLLIKHTKRNMHFLTHYPSETLWSPIWKIWHWVWRKQL